MQGHLRNWLSGFSVSSAGDVNDDGFDDLILGAPDANGSGTEVYAGSSYVVFGRAGGFTATIDAAGLNGTNGFAIIVQSECPEHVHGFVEQTLECVARDVIFKFGLVEL
jgi:hypothetical protein